MPYSVWVKNTSDQEIVAILVRYEINTTPVSRTADFFYNSLDPQLRSVMLPGSSLLITPVHSLNMHLIASTSAGLDPIDKLDYQQMAHQLAVLKNASAVKITIDSVAFKDGKIAGPDLAGTLVRINRSADAYLDLRDELRQRLANGEPDSSLISWLQSKESARVARDPSTKRIDYYVATQKRWAVHFLATLNAGQHEEFVKLVNNGNSEGQFYRLSHLSATPFE